jgi:hypothetical protein
VAESRRVTCTSVVSTLSIPPSCLRRLGESTTADHDRVPPVGTLLGKRRVSILPRIGATRRCGDKIRERIWDRNAALGDDCFQSQWFKRGRRLANVRLRTPIWWRRARFSRARSRCVVESVRAANRRHQRRLNMAQGGNRTARRSSRIPMQSSLCVTHRQPVVRTAASLSMHVLLDRTLGNSNAKLQKLTTLA